MTHLMYYQKKLLSKETVLTPECVNDLKNNLFTVESLLSYFKSSNKEEVFKEKLKEILITHCKSMDLEISDVFIKSIIDIFFKSVYKGITSDLELMQFIEIIKTQFKIEELEELISKGSFDDIVDIEFLIKKCLIQYKSNYKNNYDVLEELGVLDWIVKVLLSFENMSKDLINEELVNIFFISAYFRTLFYTNNDISNKNEIQSLLLNVIENESLIEVLANAYHMDLFKELPQYFNKMFYLMGRKEKLVISYALLSIYFTDLYLILIKYAETKFELIKYKTNALINIDNYNKKVIHQFININPDLNKRRIDIEIVCTDAAAHRAIALFVNEFERVLISYEDILYFIKYKISYVRVHINVLCKNNISNYNFEAYTPTLMPLLSGGHIYSNRLVFIRELIQNSIDSISVRKSIDTDYYSPKISVEFEIDDDNFEVNSIILIDNGMGMGRLEIERYLTSIGRSYYTASEFKKMNLSYSPISSFGIGFLSCFLVSDEITIKTLKCDYSEKGCELIIPNVEGCFFVENIDYSRNVGTEINLKIDKRKKNKKVILGELLEYMFSHFMDLEYNIKIEFKQLECKVFEFHDLYNNTYNAYNLDVLDIVEKNKSYAPCFFAIIGEKILVENKYAHTFKVDWWNKYIANKFIDLKLDTTENIISTISIEKHSIRKKGEYFFIFIPFNFEDKSLDSYYEFNCIEETYDYPYGLFITDSLNVGKKMRGESNEKVLKYSGNIKFINSGI